MMNASRIDRLVRGDRLEQLLEEVLSNGRRLPLAARAVLHEPRALELASIGLALQRLVELTYTPQAGAVALAERLATGLHAAAAIDAAAERDSSSGLVAGGALVARAIATCALDDLARQAEATGVELSASLRVARQESARASGAALFEAQSNHAAHYPRQRGLVSSPLISCILAWQLCGRTRLSAELQAFARADLLHRAIHDLRLGADRDCAGVLAIAGIEAIAPSTTAMPLATASATARPTELATATANTTSAASVVPTVMAPCREPIKFAARRDRPAAA
jgi:hypothetical protein